MGTVLKNNYREISLQRKNMSLLEFFQYLLEIIKSWSNYIGIRILNIFYQAI